MCGRPTASFLSNGYGLRYKCVLGIVLAKAVERQRGDGHRSLLCDGLGPHSSFPKLLIHQFCLLQSSTIWGYLTHTKSAFMKAPPFRVSLFSNVVSSRKAWFKCTEQFHIAQSLPDRF